MNIFSKYKFVIIVAFLYLCMFVNYYFAILGISILFQVFISIGSYKRLRRIFKFQTDICVQGTIIELKELSGIERKTFNYEYIIEFKWQDKKFQTKYQFTTLFSPVHTKKNIHVWINESDPEKSVATESSGSKNRWLILLDYIAVMVVLSVVDYFILIKIIATR